MEFHLPKFLRCIGVILLFGLTIFWIGDGKSAGDEGVILDFVGALQSMHFHWSEFIAMAGREHWIYLSHHTVWFCLQLGFLGVYRAAVFFFPLLKDPLLFNWFMSYLLVIPAFAAVYLTYRYVRTLLTDHHMAVVFCAAIWLGSYGIGFLTGGFIENALCFFMLLRLLLFNTAPQPTRLALLDALIIATKAYAFPFCGITMIPLMRKHGKKFTAIYSGSFLMFALLWLWFKTQFPPIVSAYFSWMNGPNLWSLGYFFQKFLHMFLSFSYGLVWTFPLVLLSWRTPEKSAVYYKYGGIAAIMLILNLYNGSDGIVGIAGNRYLFPFLLCLVPEMALASAALLRRSRHYLWVLVACIVLFFPSLEYRHNLVVAKADKFATVLQPSHAGPTDSAYDILPQAQIRYHPGVFAWRVLLAKWHQQRTITLDLRDGLREAIDVEAILPMTFMSRFLYAMENGHATVQTIPPDYFRVFSTMPGGLVSVLLCSILLMVVVWLGMLGRSFLQLSQEGRRST